MKIGFYLIGLIVLIAFSGQLLADNLPFGAAAPRSLGSREFRLPGQPAMILEGLFNTATGAPVQVTGGLAETVTDVTTAGLLRFIDSHPVHFQLSSADLEVVAAGSRHGKSYLTARQQIAGRSVLGTRVVLRVGRNGQVLRWGADVVNASGVVWQPAIAPAAAVAALLQAQQIAAADVVSLKEMWLRRGVELIPVYALQLREIPGLRFPRGWVDANTGEVLTSDDGIYHETLSGTLSGPVIPLNPTTPAETRLLPHATVKVLCETNPEATTDADGGFEITDLPLGSWPVQFWLEGPYVAVQDTQLDLMSDPGTLINPFQVDSLLAVPQDVAFTLDPLEMDVTPAAVNVFYQVNFVRDWWNARDPDCELLGTSLRVYPDQQDEFFRDNAGFMPAMPPFLNEPLMMFGAGGPGHHNFALLAEIVYHEYNHGVTLSYYPNDNGQDDFLAAMGEGFSDYFACTITGVPQIGLGLDIANPDNYIRSLINDLVYPADWEGEGHHDGQILSAALWEVREAIGAAIADSIFHVARYPSPDDFETYYDEVVLADDDNEDLSDGTPHLVELRTAFNRHGIGIDEPGAVEPGPVAALPHAPQLDGLYPNPFNPATTVHFTLPALADVTLTVHDLLGREVRRLTLPRMGAGAHSVRCDLSAAASGIYFIRLSALGHVQTAKAMLMK